MEKIRMFSMYGSMKGVDIQPRPGSHPVLTFDVESRAAPTTNGVVKPFIAVTIEDCNHDSLDENLVCKGCGLQMILCAGCTEYAGGGNVYHDAPACNGGGSR